MKDLLSIQDQPKTRKSCLEINALKFLKNSHIHISKLNTNTKATFISHFHIKIENWSVCSRKFTSRFYKNNKRCFFLINVNLPPYTLKDICIVIRKLPTFHRQFTISSPVFHKFMKIST